MDTDETPPLTQEEAETALARIKSADRARAEESRPAERERWALLDKIREHPDAAAFSVTDPTPGVPPEAYNDFWVTLSPLGARIDSYENDGLLDPSPEAARRLIEWLTPIADADAQTQFGRWQPYGDPDDPDYTLPYTEAGGLELFEERGTWKLCTGESWTAVPVTAADLRAAAAIIEAKDAANG